MARTLGLEPKPTVLETAMLPITPGPYMVGVAGFEPATSWSQTKRSTKLSHTSMVRLEGFEPSRYCYQWILSP